MRASKRPNHCCPKHGFPLYRKTDQCPVCREEVEDEKELCKECDGDGWVEDPDDGGTMTCEECDGTGFLDD